MIPAEQVADLREGDVVEITWPEDDAVGVMRSIRGPLHRRGSNCLYVGSMTVVGPSGEPWGADIRTLIVISRAPRPLYVNHDRPEPVPGDVVRDEEADCIQIVLRVAGSRFPDKWVDSSGVERDYSRLSPPRRLRLLVDGETGQVVPS